MTVIDEARDAAAPGIPGQQAVKRVLLVWDAPNLDMGLGSILGGRPTAAHRPRFDALGRWLLTRTAELAAGYPEAAIGAALLLGDGSYGSVFASFGIHLL